MELKYINKFFPALKKSNLDCKIAYVIQSLNKSRLFVFGNMCPRFNIELLESMYFSLLYNLNKGYKIF